MEEKTLYQLSVGVIIAGLLFLYFYAEEVDVHVDPQKIEGELTEETAHLRGRVTQLHTAEKVIFLKVEGERIESNDVILFTPEPIYVKEGDTVEITGTVEEYRGKREVVANKVEVR